MRIRTHRKRLISLAFLLALSGYLPMGLGPVAQAQAPEGKWISEPGKDSTHKSWLITCRVTTGDQGQRVSLDYILEDVSYHFRGALEWRDGSPRASCTGAWTEVASSGVEILTVESLAIVLSRGGGPAGSTLNVTIPHGQGSSLSGHIQFRVREPSVVLDKATYKPGERIEVRFHGILNPTEKDWLALVPAGCPIQHYDDEWSYTKKQSSGSLTFRAPYQGGIYEVRLFADWETGEYDLLGRSSSVTVEISEPIQSVPVEAGQLSHIVDLLGRKIGHIYTDTGRVELWIPIDQAGIDDEFVTARPCEGPIEVQDLRTSRPDEYRFYIQDKLRRSGLSGHVVELTGPDNLKLYYPVEKVVPVSLSASDPDASRIIDFAVDVASGAMNWHEYGIAIEKHGLTDHPLFQSHYTRYFHELSGATSKFSYDYVYADLAGRERIRAFLDGAPLPEEFPPSTGRALLPRRFSRSVQELQLNQKNWRTALGPRAEPRPRIPRERKINAGESVRLPPGSFLVLGNDEFSQLPKTRQSNLRRLQMQGRKLEDPVIRAASQEKAAHEVLSKHRKDKKHVKSTAALASCGDGNLDDVVFNGYVGPQGKDGYHQGRKSADRAHLDWEDTQRVKRVEEEMATDPSIAYPDRPLRNSDGTYEVQRVKGQGGGDLSAHAEKKAFERELRHGHPSVFVSQAPCWHCQQYFQARARSLGRDIVLEEPSASWIFLADGRVYRVGVN